MFVEFFLIVIQGGTNYHLVNSLQFFKQKYPKGFEKLCLKTVVAIRFGQRDTKAHCYKEY